jgi:hypothetical protein
MPELVAPNHDFVILQMLEPTPKQRMWALFRLTLGLAQMIGVGVSLCLLCELGMNDLSLGAVVVTCGLTVISVLLFGGRAPNGR